MTPAAWQWVGTALVLLVGAIAGFRYLPSVRFGSDVHAAEPGLRRTTYSELASEGERLETFDTADFLLKIAVDLYDRKHAAFEKLDAKAQGLVALIGGGASLYTLLGGFSGSTHPTLSPLLVLAAASFFGSLVLLLISLAPMTLDLPGVTRFNSAPVLNKPEMRARIARRLIEHWQNASFALNPTLRRKGRYIYVSTLMIVAGACLLLVNFLTSLALPSSPATTTKCIGGISSKGAFQVRCSQ